MSMQLYKKINKYLNMFTIVINKKHILIILIYLHNMKKIRKKSKNVANKYS